MINDVTIYVYRCGTSRWSTITSRYPSRATSNAGAGGERFEFVTINETKLGGRECSADNVAQSFRREGYRTAHIGKWHLSHVHYDQFSYEYAVNLVKKCGFDIVGGLYPENIAQGIRHTTNNTALNMSNITFAHNMEWMTSEAIKVIREESDEPFFMYFNPTVPHAHEGDSVKSDMIMYSCKDTPSGRLSHEPLIPGLTDTMDCEEYRSTVFERAGRHPTDEVLGAIWLDDMMSLHEGGVRVPMFWHYGAHMSHGSIDLPVQVIDIGPTLMEYAEIVPSYEMDGLSLKRTLSGDVKRTNTDPALHERCLFYEMQFDRAVRCGCHKYLQINGGGGTASRGRKGGLSVDHENLFDLCDGSDAYSADNMEVKNMARKDWQLMHEDVKLHVRLRRMRKVMSCHLKRVKSGDYSKACRIADGVKNIEWIEALGDRVNRSSTLSWFFIFAVGVAIGRASYLQSVCCGNSSNKGWVSESTGRYSLECEMQARGEPSTDGASQRIDEDAKPLLRGTDESKEPLRGADESNESPLSKPEQPWFGGGFCSAREEL